jgi:hypothetical protein
VNGDDDDQPDELVKHERKMQRAAEHG